MHLPYTLFLVCASLLSFVAVASSVVFEFGRLGNASMGLTLVVSLCVLIPGLFMCCSAILSIVGKTRIQVDQDAVVIDVVPHMLFRMGGAAVRLPRRHISAVRLVYHKYPPSTRHHPFKVAGMVMGSIHEASVVLEIAG